MLKLYKAVNKSTNKTIDENGKWMMGVAAIVADNKDPENQHRVRVIIPSVDEDLIFDEWIRQIAFCLGDGFGSVFIPPLGSEVVLFGELGQKYNLYYASVYNEEMMISSQLGKDTAGIHAPEDLKLIAEKVAEIIGKDAILKAEQKAEIKGNQVKLNGVEVSINGDGSVSINAPIVTIKNRIVLDNGLPI